MRRADKEITDTSAILDLMNKCEVCRIAFFDNEFPYLIPLNFGFIHHIQENKLELFFHTAPEGKKLELLGNNNRVAFEMDVINELWLSDISCNSGVKYESICGTGLMSIVADEDKLAALTAIMRHYQPEGPLDFNEKIMEKTLVLKLTVHSITAKHSL